MLLHGEGKPPARYGSSCLPWPFPSLPGSLQSDGHTDRSVSRMEVSHLLFSSSDILFLVRNHVVWNIMRTNSALDASINGIAGRRGSNLSYIYFISRRNLFISVHFCVRDFNLLLR